MQLLVVGEKDPEVRTHIANDFCKPSVGERRIAKPADCRRATCKEPTEVEDDTSANETPKTQGVHAGESNVSGSDLKGRCN